MITIVLKSKESVALEGQTYSLSLVDMFEAAYCSTGGSVWLLRGLAKLFQCFERITGFCGGRAEQS